MRLATFLIGVVLVTLALALQPAPVAACPSCDNPQLWTGPCSHSCSFCKYCSYCCGQQGIGCELCDP